MYMEEILIQKYTCVAMVTAALLTTVKVLKQPNCPSTDEWMKKKDVLHRHYGVLLSHKKE